MKLNSLILALGLSLAFGLTASAQTRSLTLTVVGSGTVAVTEGIVVVDPGNDLNNGSPDYDVADGTILTLTPTPSVGNRLFKWVVDGSAVWTSTVALTMSANHTVVATFASTADTELVPNGFSDAEEAALAALLNQFKVGDVLTGPTAIDLGFISLQTTEKLSVTGLPLGLSFDPVTKLITGAVKAELGGLPVEVKKTIGRVAKAITMNFSVEPYPFLGTYEMLLEHDPAGLPDKYAVGKAKLTVTGPNLFSATLEFQGQRLRSSRVFTSSIVGDTLTVNFTFAAGKGNNPAVATVQFVIDSTEDTITGSSTGLLIDSVAVTPAGRGFIMVRPGREPKLRVTVALENADDGDGLTTPGGAGSATGIANGAGLLPLKGVLGDAQSFTTSLLISQTNQSIVFIQPYADKTKSFFGGIMTIGDLGLPSRGAPGLVLAPVGLRWRKFVPNAPSLTEKSYASGFGNGTNPLEVLPTLGRWVPVKTAEGLALSLDLTLRELHVTNYVGVPTLNNGQAYPTKFALRNTFALIRLLPTNSVPWTTGKAVAATGTFTGTMALPAPATKVSVSGVLLQEAPGSLIGVGLMKIPSNTTGSFYTASLQLDNIE